MWKFIDNNQLILVSELCPLFASSDSVSIASAFIRLSGVHLLIDDIAQVTRRGGDVRLLFGTDFAISEAEAIRRLLAVGVQVKHYGGREMFHPKAYIFKNSKATTAIIGSSNISGSALTTGREWSILIDSELCDLRSIEAEFERLWGSPASHEPTEALLSTLEQAHRDTRPVDLAKEDRVQVPAAGFPMPPVPPAPSTVPAPATVSQPAAVPFATMRREYVVSQTSRNHRHHWWFNLSSNKLRSLAAQGDFDVVAVCDAGSPDERVFAVPYSYLRDRVFPSARLGDDGRYMFEIAKDSFEFSFRGPVRFDGTPFLRNGGRPR
jgi:HKD family nuclease